MCVLPVQKLYTKDREQQKGQELYKNALILFFQVGPCP